MRQKAAIVFLLLHFFTATELHQLVRFPLLLTHYTEHQKSASLNLWDFLVLHYATESHQAQESHESLPFQGSCKISLLAIWVAVPDLQGINIKVSHKGAAEKIVLPSLMLPSHSGQSIWQPPRA